MGDSCLCKISDILSGAHDLKVKRLLAQVVEAKASPIGWNLKLQVL
jgi:hypothetical protein